MDYQDKLARFLENHDEPRAAATFAPEVHAAAAVLTYFSPGLRFFHQGQFEGRPTAHLAASGAAARTNRWTHRLAQFYARLLAVLRQPLLRDGRWSLLECVPAWQDNPTCGQFHRLAVGRQPQTSGCAWS